MSDLIKRSDAIEAYADIYWIDDRLNLAYREELDQIDEKIRNIPTVEIADRPQGEWIEVDDASISCRCSVCGWEAHLYEDDVYGMPYCPNCGARMKGADDE